jgi:hypothetical protein
MSFLIDPPWLYANGRALARATPQRGRLAAATLGVFLVTRARSGRDWMLNSGLFKLDPDRAGTPTHLVSGALFATYPLWLWLGLRHGQD